MEVEVLAVDDMREGAMDKMLEDVCFGSTVFAAFADGQLPRAHPFSWESVAKDPKGDHGETVMARTDDANRALFFKDMRYELLHTGGFLRLATTRGRVYWAAQNTSFHTTPDWKLHFSVNLGQTPTAWNIVAALFMEMRCEMGMKVCCAETEDEWSEKQRGRELTVYMFNYHSSYRGYLQGTLPELPDNEFYLGREMEVYGHAFWYTFIVEAERRLSAARVRARGCADGDLALPGCAYASLRNEAFVKIKGEWTYPPNDSGWNVAEHPNPYVELIFFLRQVEKAKSK
jgi:hypothetical protein